MSEPAAPPDLKQPEDHPAFPRRPARRRMTRREFWSLVGVSAATWVMVIALTRIWWRVYLVAF